MPNSHEHGQVTLFVVMVTGGLLALAGLIFDGGNAISATLRAAHAADQAAKAGVKALEAQAPNAAFASDPETGVRAAQAFLQDAGQKGAVRVEGDRVVVTVTISQRTTLLRIVGVSVLPVAASGEAAASALTRPGP